MAKRFGPWAIGLTLGVALACAITLISLHAAGVIDGHAENVLGWVALAVITYTAYMWATRAKRRMWARRVDVARAEAQRLRGGSRSMYRLGGPRGR
jgi:hypothetical protein